LTFNLKSPLWHEVPSVKTECVDVSDLPAVEAVVNGAGPIHLLVNNAGVSQLQSVLDTTPDAYDRVMSVNLKAPVFLSQYVARGMVERGDGGAIVNVSSVASSVALTDHLAYCTSKAGMDMATKVMALELGRHKVSFSLSKELSSW
jgi:L-xylulose reductase